MASLPLNRPSDQPAEPLYASHTRFEIELEFIQSLSSPLYLLHLAQSPLFTSPTFIAYLHYLLYWTRPEYVKYIHYPGPTLRVLEMLQLEAFRRDVKMGGVGRLVEEWVGGKSG